MHMLMPPRSVLVRHAPRLERSAILACHKAAACTGKDPPASTAQPAVAPAARLPAVMRHCGTPSKFRGLLSAALATTKAGTRLLAVLLLLLLLLAAADCMLTLAKGAAARRWRWRRAWPAPWRRSDSSCGRLSYTSSNSSCSPSRCLTASAM